MEPVHPIFKNVSRETFSRLTLYHDLLKKWNASINLIGPDHDIWTRHIADSLQLFNLFPDKNITLADLGSGAGLPGLLLAILGIRDVHLIESDGKKINFLREAARITQTTVTPHHARLEDVQIPGCNAITARAFSELSNLLAWSAHLRSADTFCVFPKGKNYSIELEQARKEWEFDLLTSHSQTHSEGVILTLKNIQPVRS